MDEEPMEICEKAEIFVHNGNDNDLEFDHSKLILRRADGEYFYAKTGRRIFQFSQIEVDELEAIRIPSDHIWPLADPTFTRAPEPLPSDCYLKRRSLLYYDDTSDSHGYSDRNVLVGRMAEMLRDGECIDFVLEDECHNGARKMFRGTRVMYSKSRCVCFRKSEILVDVEGMLAWDTDRVR